MSGVIGHSSRACSTRCASTLEIAEQLHAAGAGLRSLGEPPPGNFTSALGSFRSAFTGTAAGEVARMFALSESVQFC